jgi:hypothetical protein
MGRRRSSWHHAQWFTINVWAGLIGDVLVGPHVLPRRLTGPRYRNVLENDLAQPLEEDPLTILQRMWFLHDGAPTHFSSALLLENTSTTLSSTDGLDELDLWNDLRVRQILVS